MKIGIVGRHPDLEKGFNAVMSLLFAKGFSYHGCDVTLYLPNSECHKVFDLLVKNNISDLESLNRYGSNFSVKVLNKNLDGLDRNEDFIIWQSYRPEEDSFRKALNDKGLFIVKNPPRIFSGDIHKDRMKVKGLKQQFDFIASSLISDFEEYQMIESSNFIEYVPRGFDTDLLSATKTTYPSIGFDKSVKATHTRDLSIKHIVSTGKLLKKRYKNIEFLSLRDNVEELASIRVPPLGYPDFYENFINRIWIYMPIDFDYSVHVKGKHINPLGEHRYIGLYENQVIETQLAGGLVVSRLGDIPTELIMLPEVSIVDSYEVDAVYAVLVNQLDNFKEYSSLSKKKALERHDYLKTTQLLLQHIKNRL